MAEGSWSGAAEEMNAYLKLQEKEAELFGGEKEWGLVWVQKLYQNRHSSQSNTNHPQTPFSCNLADEIPQHNDG